MKKKRTTIIMIVLFIIGLLILLYPSISNLYNEKQQSKTIVDYEEVLNKYTDSDFENMIKEAEEYNKQLASLNNAFNNYNQIKNYKSTLDINGYGMMGYLSIDKIKVELPIYHTSDSDVLAKYVGHLEGTSLPVGGESTHSVLVAHRGLPSSKLFTDLDELEIGDKFTITILNKKLTYEVDKITIVKPEETSELNIVEGEDYVTLLTCTPYGINTHRLLVRGKRVDNSSASKYIATEGFRISKYIVMCMIGIPIIFIMLLVIIFKPVKKDNDLLLKIKEEANNEKNS